MNDLSEHYVPHIVSGGPVAYAITGFEALRKDQLAARQALCKEYGASKCLGTEHSVSALLFEGKPPEGWRLRPGRPYDCYLPPKGALGKALRARMADLPLASWEDFSHALNCNGVLGGSAGGGFCIRVLMYEQIGETMILHVPKESKWQPPEGCTPIKVSEYFQIKEGVTA